MPREPSRPFSTAVMPYSDEDHGVLLAAVARLEKKVDLLSTAESERIGSSRVWRIAGGLAATLAISLGGAALNYAQQAASDHQRLGQLEGELNAMREAAAREERIEAERWQQMTVGLSEARATVDVTRAVLDRVEHRLNELDTRERGVRRGR